MNNIKVINTIEKSNIKVEVLQYEKLGGSKSTSVAERLYFAERMDVKMKQVRITLNGAKFKTESGALSYMKGNITATNNVAKKLFKNLAASVLTGEKAFKPVYEGTGEIYLEPSFGHFLIMELNDEEIIVDKKMFYACEEEMEVGVSMQKNISSAAFGGEGLFQTRISGTGIVVLYSEVPMDEIKVMHLNNEKLMVDGNFAMLRKGDISFSVQMMNKGIIGTLTSGEGLLQTFEGTGEVWIAPTEALYQQLESSLIKQDEGYSSNTNVE
ncbi:MAG: AIM24 family protein [Clostridia bacterium]|jgi:uncharacterized protein (AIM24 family)|nr:AIM24 family protein [Clostridia bacterium]